MLVITALALVVASLGGCRPYRGAPASATATVGLDPHRPGGVRTRATFTLGNGLDVVLEENHAAPVVAIQAWVHVGAADDPSGQEGLAHLFQHLLFLSTRSRPAGQVGRDVAAVGGRIGAWTGYDQTVFHEVVAAAFVDLGLDVMADVLAQPALAPADLENARRHAIDDVRQSAVVPDRIAAQAALATAFPAHPYGRPVMGTEPALAAVTADQVKQFFARFYGAANSTLVVVGDFDASALRSRVEAAFGAWRSGTRAAARLPTPPQLSPLVRVFTADVPAPQLVVAFRTPDVRDPDAPALELLAAVLGSGKGARLEVEIARNRQLATTNPRAYLFNGSGVGLLVMSASLGSGRVDDAARAVIEEALRLSRDRIAGDELSRARTLVEGDGASDQASLQGYARKLALFATAGGDPAMEVAYLDRLRAIEAGDLTDVAARTFRPENLVVTAVLPLARDPARDDRAAKLTARLQVVAAASQERASATALGSPRPPSGRGVVEYQLASGVRLLVLHDDTAKQLSIRAMWSGGVRLEDSRLAGATSLLARLLGRGTKTRSAEQLANDLAETAGTIDGIAGMDSLGLRGDFLASRWERGVELVVDCLRNPKLGDEDVERERRVLLDAIRARDEDPTELASRLFAGALFGRHPYREDLLGTSDSVAGLDRRRLLDHYRRYYGPGGLTLAMVGPVDPQRVAAKVQTLFADAPAQSGSRELPVSLSSPARLEPVEVFRFIAKPQARVVLGYPGLTMRDPDRFALEVLAEVLGGAGGRLATLRDQRGLFEGVAASSQEGVDPGYLAVYVTARPDTLEATVPALRAEIARLAESGVSDEEVARARRLLVGTHAVALERRGSVALALALHGAFGEAGSAYRRDVDELSKVTTADVVRVARKVIDSRREVLAVIRPRDQERPAASAGDRRPAEARR